MNKKQFYFFIGTTAELIKLAPVLKEFKSRKQTYKIITSGQNTLEFKEIEGILGKESIYYDFQLKPPQKNLHILLQFSIWMFKALVNYLLYFRKEFKKYDKKSIYFIVHGDTVSSLLGAISVKFFGIRLIHIESGLRSFNFFEPFPEELSRFVVSHLADVHFCPNAWAVGNLKKYKGVKINTKNNTLLESLQLILVNAKKSKFTKKLSNKKFFLLILHRQEHMFFNKNSTRKYLKLFLDLTSNDLNCVLVLHKLTEDFIKNEGLSQKIKRNKNVITIPRLPYNEFMQIMKMSEFIATDGGSNQEESSYFGKPCLILRNVTERIEGLGENAVLIRGDNQVVKEFVKNYRKYKRKPVKYHIAPSKIIVDNLLR